MWLRLLALWVVSGASIACLAGTDLRTAVGEKQVTPEALAATAAANNAAQKLLHKPLPPLEFNRAPLSDVISALRNASGARIFVNWRALETIGIRRDEGVTLGLPGRSLADSLAVVMTVAQPQRDGWGIGVEDGAIVVTTKDDLNKNVSVRVYDIRDVIGRPATADERQRRVAALTRLVQSQIDPASWKTRGGSVGALRELQGQLIVTQTPGNQQKLGALLDEVQALCAAEPARH